MPPRELSAQALEAATPRVGIVSADSPTSTPASATEAAELPNIEARAEAARARATRLRQQAEAASSDQGNRSGPEETSEATEDTDADKDAGVTVEEGEAQSAPSGRRWLRRPSRKALIAFAGLVVICASLTTSGLVVWHHHNVAQQRQRSAEFATTARNAVVAMMSISADKARDDMQRFADDTTGSLKASILLSADNVVKEIEQSKVTTKVAVQAVAVESMTKDSAVVLVAAKSEITKPDQAKPESRSWRVVVSVERDGGQLKISKVEFVP
jgi:Mce-associated membrane protein